jgi:hypothetical protein
MRFLPKVALIALLATVIGGHLLLIRDSSGEVNADPANDPNSESFEDPTTLFIENAGQFDSRVLFQARTGKEVLWITKDGLWITVIDHEKPLSDRNEEYRAVNSSRPQAMTQAATNLKISFVDADLNSAIVPFGRSATSITIGTAEGPYHARAWRGVRYHELYPGLDLELFGQNGRWNWRLIAEDDDVTTVIALDVGGTTGFSLTRKSINLSTSFGQYELPPLSLLQPNNTLLMGLEGQKNRDETVRITASAQNQSVPELLVESVEADRATSDLLYSTYFGSSAWDEGDSITVDEDGSTFVTGYTQALTFTTDIGSIYFKHGIDVYVLKLNQTGTDLEYFLWFFTAALNAEDYGNDIAIDELGHAYITGRTHSPDFCAFFGVVPGYDTDYNGNGDAYLFKIQPDGSGLTYCTYFGGDDIETGNAVSVDEHGNGYVTGGTWSTDFPTTPGAFDGDHNGLRDVFISVVDELGTSLIYSSFLGGSGQDEGVDLDIDASGSAYITGWTTSSDYITTTGAYDPDYNGGIWDGFVTKMSTTGDYLIYSSYLGGTEEDRGLAIKVNSEGFASIGGMTKSDNFPTTPGAFDTTFGGGDCGPEICADGYVTRINIGGDGLSYSTYLGGGAEDAAYSLDLDRIGQVYVTGQTLSASTFPTTTDALDGSHNGAKDTFLSVVGATGASLRYSTFIGGADEDAGFSIRIADEGVVYLTGRTQSVDFPTTPESYDPFYNGDNDAFVTTLGLHLTSRVFLPAVMNQTGE